MKYWILMGFSVALFFIFVSINQLVTISIIPLFFAFSFWLIAEKKRVDKIGIT